MQPTLPRVAHRLHGPSFSTYGTILVSETVPYVEMLADTTLETLRTRLT